MNAVQFQHQNAALVQRPQPTPGPDRALIRVGLVGICRTDLELLQGYYDFSGIPGHEFVGVVEASPGRPELVGRRVTADINQGCGHCGLCRRGLEKHCRDRRVIGIKGADGAMAQYLAAPLENLHLIPEGLENRRAVFAEPLAAALEISQQVHLTADMKVAVLGAGKLGLLIALALRCFCPGLVLLGKYESALAVAAAQGVATRTITEDAGPADVGGAYDLAIEATGRPDGPERALGLVRPRGTVVIKTTSRQASRIHLARAVVDEITLLGSRCGPIGLAVRFLADGLLDPQPLIEAEYPLSDFAAALDHARRPGAKKVLLRP